MDVLPLSRFTQLTAGFLLLSILAVEYGGYVLTTVVTGDVARTDFQIAYARAGHAHAGVLVILALTCVLLADATSLRGSWSYVARLGVPVSAILMPAGFFASSAGEGATGPNAFMVLIWIGAASLTAGVVTLGVGLLRAGFARRPQAAAVQRA